MTIAPPAPNFEALLQPTPVPSLANPSDRQFRTAIEAGTHAGARLSELSKLAAELSNGVIGARRANERLVEELATLHALLGSASEQRLALQHRVAELEREVLQLRGEAERERRFLTSQHDDFIAALIEEHEAELAAQSGQPATAPTDATVADLTQQLALAEAARARAEAECERAREARALAQAQRDEAQSRADRRERERDELRAEASLLRAGLGASRTASTAPPPAMNPRPPSYRPPPALRLDAGELDSTLHARPSVPKLPTAIPRQAPPPAELERAIYTPARSASAFPRVSTRPGVGGPKPSEPPPPPSFGSVSPTGWTPPPPAAVEQPSTIPPPRPRVVSAASLPQGLPSQAPALKQKPDPATRPLISYSVGKDGVKSETLEGARLSSKPPRK